MLALRRLSKSASYVARSLGRSSANRVTNLTTRRSLATSIRLPSALSSGFLSGFTRQVNTNGGKTAFICDGTHLSYDDVYRSSLRCALFLREQHGVREGDVVSCITPNVATTQFISIAAKMLNCAFFPINDTLPADTIEEYADRVQSKLVVCSDRSLFTQHSNVVYMDERTGRWDGDDYLRHAAVADMEQRVSAALDENHFSDDLPGLLMQTSGSTALPKIVVHGANTSDKSFDTQAQLNPLCAQTTLMACEPYHVSSYFLRMSNLCAGGTLVLPSKTMRDKRASARAKAMEMVRLSELHSVYMAPAIVTPIYEMVSLNLAFPESVRVVLSAGDIIPVGLLQKFMRLHAKNPDTVIINGYGSTEVGMVAMSNPVACTEENANNVQLVRDELLYMNKTPTVQHRVDPATGELLVKTPGCMQKYFGAADKTAEVMTDDGFYRMGDTVHVAHDEGESGALRFMVVARNKQVIVTEGGYVFPQYIEDVLLEHEDVIGAVVVGADVTGSAYKRPVAFVTTRRELDVCRKHELVDALLQMVATKRDAREVPAKVFVLDSIPKSGVGKVNRTELTAMANSYFNDIERVDEKLATADSSMRYVEDFESQPPLLRRQSSQ